ncbi:bifunctional DNA primase/polymerase [Thermus thermophilus]|uniref:bifunctional DNA primase/polymerase n=2 Tax=Thermus thermophilus TaxID=274 RepID=UPI00216AE5E4|nr:bifunctional DNA primase/polymerase [Thermus thermophilus]
MVKNQRSTFGGFSACRSAALEAARAYARMGYPVLPLHPGEKRPHPGLVPHGLKDATGDPATLEAWWRACPEAGVGLLPPEGVLVLDVDQGEVWEALRRDFPPLEAAPRQRTPKGGRHVFLRLPEGVRLSASVRAIPGVDLRGMGRAYVVAAPTRLKDGRTYTWEVPLVRPEALPPVPQALLLKLLPPPPPPRPAWTPVEGASPARLRALLEAYAAQVARAPEGTRHPTLLRYGLAAFGLVAHGLDPREAEEALLEAALASGLPEKEAREVLRWARQVGEAKPLPLAPPGFSANGGVFRKAVCGKPEPSPSQKSVFRKAATYRIGGLRKRRGVV